MLALGLFTSGTATGEITSARSTLAECQNWISWASSKSNQPAVSVFKFLSMRNDFPRHVVTRSRPRKHNVRIKGFSLATFILIHFRLISIHSNSFLAISFNLTLEISADSSNDELSNRTPLEMSAEHVWQPELDATYVSGAVPFNNLPRRASRIQRKSDILFDSSSFGVKCRIPHCIESLQLHDASATKNKHRILCIYQPIHSSTGHFDMPAIDGWNENGTRP